MDTNPANMRHSRKETVVKIDGIPVTGILECNYLRTVSAQHGLKYEKYLTLLRCQKKTITESGARSSWEDGGEVGLLTAYLTPTLTGIVTSSHLHRVFPPLSRGYLWKCSPCLCSCKWMPDKMAVTLHRGRPIRCLASQTQNNHGCDYL